MLTFVYTSLSSSSSINPGLPTVQNSFGLYETHCPDIHGQCLDTQKCFLQSYYEHYLDVKFTADRQIGAEAPYNESVQPQTVRQHDLDRLRIPRHLTTLFPSWHRRCQINLGMGARRKSWRPRRSLPETDVGFTKRNETKTRRQISRRDRDETFVALETQRR